MSALSFRTVDSDQSRRVVWIHGFLGSSNDLLPVAQQLSSHAGSILVDLPGHGESSHIDPSSIEEAADRVARVIDELKIARPVVAGYSLGGRVALSLAARHPHVVGPLAVISAMPGIVGADARARRRERDGRVAEFLRTWPEDEFVDFWYRQSVFRSLRRDRRLLRIAVESKVIADKELAARALVNYSPGQQKPVWDVLPALRSGLLYVAGSEDGKYVATGVRVAKQCRRARLVVIRGSGHVVHLERPRALARALSEFLERTS